jgi:hypothetical protein
MINLSEKPINAGNALKRPKTLEFQTKLRHEEENEHRKAEQFARLSVSNYVRSMWHDQTKYYFLVLGSPAIASYHTWRCNNTSCRS